MRFDALNRLWETVRSTSHDFRASTDVYPSLDVERIASDLALSKAGAERGAQNEPPSEASGFDELELRIVERVEDEKKAAHQSLESQMQTFGERLTNLDFDGEFVLIKQANATTITDYIAEWQSGIDELHPLRRALYDAEQERVSFRQRHSLDRPARLQSSRMKTLKILFLIACVFFEMIFNGSFLAGGSEEGLLGGTTLAAGFAALNIGSAVLAAFAVKYARHRSFLGKLFGVITFPVYLAFATLINLALAHYRETSEVLLGDAGREVIRRMLEAPLDLSDVQSWVLFGVGLLFSFAAFIDAWALADPYPGYSGVETRLQKARAAYVDTRQDLIEGLRDVRNEYTTKIEEILRGLGVRKREYDAIITHRTRLGQLFVEHQNQLNRAANALLAIYREANKKARTSAAPEHFGRTYELQRVQPPHAITGEIDDKELTESLRQARDELTMQAQRFAEEFSRAVERYHTLDNLHPDQMNGPAQT